jgi:hypothetical protein
VLEKSKLKKNATAASLQGEIAREIEELFGSQALEEIDFEALETAVRRRALQLAACLLEQRFNRDHGDYQGSSLSCACGRRARNVERRWKSFHSCLLG